jgi:hypothetical protein
MAARLDDVCLQSRSLFHRKREDLSAAAQQKEKKQSASRAARALYETILYL